VSVAVRGPVLYVLNARDGGSVQGFLRIGGTLVRIPGWHRSLGLDPTAAPEFTNTPGQVAFTPDGRNLVVTTKANGSNIDVFAVSAFGGLSVQPVVNADPGQVPFAVSFDAGRHLVVSEAANAVATFTINNDGTLSLVDREQTGQAATCWIVRDGSNFYASNAGSANLSGYHDAGTGTLTALGTTSTDPGTVDAAVSSDGRFLYAQTGANGIVDEFRVARDGSLTRIGAVTVPGSAGGEGIAAG
jgi:6-phosphogluconolactonase (cycloisomerase 2 family)